MLIDTTNAMTYAVVAFTILMQECMPPAQNSVVILQLDHKKERAAKMPKTLIVIYSLSTIPVTLLPGWCLMHSGIMNVL